MPPPIGACALCLRPDQELQSSHLLPAAIYKAIGQGTGQAVKMTPATTVLTSRQLQAPLLCRECEDRLGRGGESWTIPRLWKEGGSFQLRELLAEGEPAGQNSDLRVYTARDVPGFEVDQLVYFAASISTCRVCDSPCSLGRNCRPRVCGHVQRGPASFPKPHSWTAGESRMRSSCSRLPSGKGSSPSGERNRRRDTGITPAAQSPLQRPGPGAARSRWKAQASSSRDSLDAVEDGLVRLDVRHRAPDRGECLAQAAVADEPLGVQRASRVD